MGAGVAYPHKHFVLVDFDEIMEANHMGEDWDDMQAHLREVMELEVGADSNSHVGQLWNSGWNTHINFEIDSTGGVPCIYVEEVEYPYFGKFAMEYADESDTVDEVVGNWNEYNTWVKESIEGAFVKLARMYPFEVRVPTSAWTSQPYLHSRGELL
ncbi:hypothetical protein EalM132_00152 [Exiguobacterium phage vB_EalM-132]|nr:hypothetical protein EalM132_00152 [Exiguobacterium phage vB_EalM-132]